MFQFVLSIGHLVCGNVHMNHLSLPEQVWVIVQGLCGALQYSALCVVLHTVHHV